MVIIIIIIIIITKFIRQKNQNTKVKTESNNTWRAASEAKCSSSAGHPC